MPKLRPLSANEVGRLLRAHGFVFVHRRGSHLIYRRQLPGGDTATVPVPNRREIPVGTLKSIVGLSGLQEALFRR
ncbi:MAG: type II toxin-antitoxin system HicA family toxin [Limisphaerales bacterium]